MASKSISKSVVWQLIGKSLLQGIAFFTAPIFTRILTPKDYGLVSLYCSWVSIITVFIGLNVGSSVGNARIKFADENIYSYLSSIITISLIPFVLILCVSIFFNKQLVNILGLKSDLMFLLVLQSFSTFLIDLFVLKLDVYKEVEKSAILSLMQTILVIALSLILVIKFDLKATGRIIGQAIPTIVIGLLILITVYSKGKVFWNSKYNKFCLVFSLPLLGHSLGNLLYTQTDRIMLRWMISETELGVYSVSYALCSILMIIYMAFNNAWVPFYYDMKRDGEIDSIIAHSKRYIRLFTLICVCFLLISVDIFKLIAPKEYWDGIKIIPVLVLSFYFGFLYLFPANFEFYNCCTKLIPIGTILSALINIVINFLLIPKYGMIGASIGTFVSHFFLFVFHEFIALHIIKQDFEYKLDFYSLWVIIIFLSALISFLLEKNIYIRWMLALVDVFYIVHDIFKEKNIF